MSNTKFECTPIREHQKGRGRPSKVGVEWKERTAVNRAYRYNAFLFMLGAPLLIGLGMWARLTFRNNYGYDTGFIQFGLVCGAFGLGIFYWPAPRRGLLFTDEGRIAEKHWLRGYRRWAGVTLDEIVSIGTSPSSTWDITWTQTVEIVTLSGDTFVVAEHLHPHHARKVSVQLNHALNEMKAAMVPEKSTSVGRVAQPLIARRVID